jgi:predicted RNase H-like HicB family nuclease
MRASLQFQMKVPVRVYKGEADFVAHCPIFDVSSQGKTHGEAKKNLVEAMVLFITSCYEMGTLYDVLKDCGFKPGSRITEKICLKKDQELINIPLPFVVNNQQAACHA